MTRATQRQARRKQAKLRSELYGRPWAIIPQALNELSEMIEVGDLDAVQSALSIGSGDDRIESAMTISNGVATIPVTGVLRDSVDYMVRWGGASSYQLIERDFVAAISNEQVKSIVLYCDSPGGSAVGVKRLADAIFKARGSKPIVAYVQGVCGSACYYLACAADRIEATADSMVGSVGTIFPHMEMSGMLKEFGYGVTVITNADSPKKGHGNSYEPLTPEAKKTLQDFVDSYGRPFIEDVARYRGISDGDVVAKFGQGDAMRADLAITNNMIDKVVSGFSETLAGLGSESNNTGGTTPVVSNVQSLPVADGMSATSTISETQPVEAGPFFNEETDMKVSKKIRAQLFALDLIESPDASDEICEAALKAWFRGAAPSDEAAILKGLRASSDANDEEDDSEDEDDEDKGMDDKSTRKPASNVANAHQSEMAEARLSDLKSSADLINQAAGRTAVSAEMVIEAFESKLDAKGAMAKWSKTLAEQEPGVSGAKVTGEGRDRFAADAIDALAYRAGDNPAMKISDNALAMAHKPLWAIAGECLALSGQQVDMYGSREIIAEEAMQMGDATRRTSFFSGSEDRRYIQSTGTPFSRPGDFPNILSGLANKFLDTIELDDDYSYPEISATLPGGLNDFKPAMMINKGVVEEMDELADAEQLKDLGLEEEVLSYIFLRRFGNRWGWTPVMIANDDMGAFAEGMLGLADAWQVTQNRLVLDRYTGSETLLDGSALFANRADTGTGTIPAANNNLRGTGAAPSDTEWGAMSTLYAGIGGINTGRRVRGTLNTILVPTNGVYQEAVRTFETYPVIGESKQAATTANIGLYRNKVRVVPESELNSVSATAYYGMRSPTRLNTATVVRAYFNGFGTAGRRERWYDPSNKTTYVSLEGRIAVAVKNWRYAIKNAGTGL